MSEFHVTVIQLGKVGKHPNADNLSISNIHGGYPCIFNTGDFKEGDLATYVPIDSLVPVGRPEFKFLASKEGRDRERIKAKRLRGIFSMGLLVPAPPNTKPGDNVQAYFDIIKYEPPMDTAMLRGENEKDPGIMPIYTDIEGLRKYKHWLIPGEEVVFTEKLHGTNARYAHDGERLWVGSHKCIKKSPQEHGKSVYWDMVDKYNLEDTLEDFPGLVLFGEIYGQVQKGFTYDADLQDGKRVWTSPKFRLFDILNSENNRYLNYDAFKAMAKILGLETVPELYRGPWSEELMQPHSTGKSTLNEATIREGFVVSVMDERWEYDVGRIKFKMVGEDFLIDKRS